MSIPVPGETSTLLSRIPPGRVLERHTENDGLVRDAIIGLADGLTVPFAVTAGLSSINQEQTRIGSTTLVILGGAAELFAGSISMSLGAYLATVTDAQHFHVEEAREQRQVADTPGLEGEMVVDMFAMYGLSREEISPLLENFRRNPEAWVKFMMDFELKLERPLPSQPFRSALTMGMAYFIGQYTWTLASHRLLADILAKADLSP
ncbi:Vacuolar iron transporter-like protein [Hapsidospora chrysogenum ATCC 11550]|uniref:Vacuolar iron transporter-like protein n=1 Tax=Hapsidospora chrysogenum (strain ATCC 11550 / CBS 779.69 / DSM 880 / IAM 14645 / JCM 23072 / IMI 49137) TaxID=857340 RepID=A0A086T1B8_HAPC1|nr:Vacuolar iron transporter-like protein [Hapsidospora chrysogenum ATCC 11550]